MSDWTGILDLDVENKHGKTVMKNVYFHGALKVMRPVYHNDIGQPCYYILNPGGAYLDEDTYRLKIRVRDQARLTLTTQSATKIYKTPKGYAYQETDIYLDEDSYLEYLTDPLIAYKNARYIQETRVHMKKGATFLYSDILTPGWSEDGNLFTYDNLRLKNKIYLEDKLVAYDHIKLNPSSQHMEGLGFMEGFTHLGSFFVVGDRTDATLLDEIYDIVYKIQEKHNNFKFGLSMLSVKGFTMRVLASNTQLIEHIFAECHREISQQWFQIEPSSLRKY